MAELIITERSNMVALANTVRNKTGQTKELTLGEILDAFENTEVAKNQDITITENGTYTPASGFTGFGSVNVEVEGSGGDIPDASTEVFGVSASSYGMAEMTNLSSVSVSNKYTRGWKFKTKEEITVVGLRHSFSSSNGRAKILKLWDESGNELGKISVQDTIEVDEWVEYSFDTPITLSANANYVVSCCASYAMVTTKFATNPKIEFIGSGSEAGDAFPTYLGGSNCFPVDIVIGSNVELPSVYQISRSILDNFALAVRRLSGVSKGMTPEEMIVALNSIS